MTRPDAGIAAIKTSRRFGSQIGVEALPGHRLLFLRIARRGSGRAAPRSSLRPAAAQGAYKSELHLERILHHENEIDFPKWNCDRPSGPEVHGHRLSVCVDADRQFDVLLADAASPFKIARKPRHG